MQINTQKITPCLWFDNQKAMLKMKKIEMEKINQAYEGLSEV